MDTNRHLSNQHQKFKNIILGLSIILIFSYRFFFIPGIPFNLRLWDDEFDWVKSLAGRNFLEYVTYRDAPGYFVFLPRTILLIVHLVPWNFEITLRFMVLLVQMICIWYATNILECREKNFSSWILIFYTFSFLYIEDMNYLHNIAYFFIFPIIYILKKTKESKSNLSFANSFLILILIDKPITAILVISLITLIYFSKKKLRIFEWLLLIYSAIYLYLYLILPNRFITPVNSDISTIIPFVTNFPWVIGLSIFPIFYIGINGFLHYVNLDGIRMIFGYFLYIVPLTALFILSSRFITLRKIRKVGGGEVVASSLLFLLSYILIYVNHDSYWIKSFPLWTLNVPQHLWNRWSATVPFFLLGTIWLFAKKMGKQKFAFCIFLIVLIQNILLQFIAFPWLRRWW